MSLSVIITGATGMVGKGVLLECLDHSSVDNVLVIGRNSVEMDHPKLKELIHSDFIDFSNNVNALKGYDACYFCLGVSAAGMEEAEYIRITHDFTMSLAGTLHTLTPQMTFCYVSGQGTDSSEKGRMMWARVKGKTENDLLKLQFKQTFLFRPGTIIPLRGIRSRTRLYQFFYDYLLWLIKFIKVLAPKSIVNTTQLGLAMINSTLHGYHTSILTPKDILQLAQWRSMSQRGSQ